MPIMDIKCEAIWNSKSKGSGRICYFGEDQDNLENYTSTYDNGKFHPVDKCPGDVALQTLDYTIKKTSNTEFYITGKAETGKNKYKFDIKSAYFDNEDGIDKVVIENFRPNCSLTFTEHNYIKFRTFLDKLEVS